MTVYKYLPPLPPLPSYFSIVSKLFDSSDDEIYLLSHNCTIKQFSFLLLALSKQECG